MIWLIEINRLNTIKDLQNGAIGKYSVKSLLVKCSQQEIKKYVPTGWSLKSAVDFETLQARQTAENIKWIFSL